MSASEPLLYLLKTRGPQTAQQLADALRLTSMGARRQLLAWQGQGVVGSADVSDKVGRPARHWMLTEAGHGRFPDRHADLTLQLIDQVRALFGEAGLDKLIDGREAASLDAYRARLAGVDAWPARVAALARARAAEGYMADVEPQADGSVLLIENHCPICAAARECQRFCRSELAVFRQALGGDCTVERSEHLLAGARRCVYVIKPVAAGR